MTFRLSLFCLLLPALFLFPSPLSAGEGGAALSGRVLDETGAVVPAAVVTARSADDKLRRTTTADAQGQFRLEQLPPGSYQVSAEAPGFSPRPQQVELLPGSRLVLDLALVAPVRKEQVTVLATHIVGSEEAARTIPGSFEVLSSKELDASHVLSFSEALRRSPGVHVRDEEGFGLRPNIGLRGLNPTRSSKLLLLEDGVPLAYAPYGDNASYYHPPIERFSSIEILKGSGQILYGPSTVGGVINYITPDPPQQTSGSVTLAGGNRNYLNAMGDFGTTLGDTGLLVHFMRKQGEGARDNLRFGLNDLNLKVITNVGDRHTLMFKGNYYGEDSNVTYSGLTLDEYQADPRQNPFRNDFFFGDRGGLALTHSYAFNGRTLLTTNVYGSVFQRHWWRQSSNSGQRPNDASDAACAGMENLNTTCGNEGRLRKYYTFGIDPHLRITHDRFGVRSETDIGFRLHFEDQNRIQENGPLPTSRSGVVVEDNERNNAAYSGFFQNRFMFERVSITPGVRVEHVRYKRVNHLANSGAGVSGRTHLTQVVPGIGVSFAAASHTTAFAGVHRGFAPPRTEDIINNSTGGAVDLDPELSWNYELGLRTQPIAGLRFDGTFFRMDYENQVVPASLAGGVGATLTNGGQTLHQGVELGARVDSAPLLQSTHNLYARTAYTWLPVSKFTGVRFSNVSGFGDVSITGNRLPYSPEHLLSVTLGYSHPRGIDAQVEAQYLGDQFGDDLNTLGSTANGQRGLLPANTNWNAALNYRVDRWRSTFFVAVKNLLNDTFIVDRSRGIIPNNPRLVHAGVRYRF